MVMVVAIFYPSWNGSCMLILFFVGIIFGSFWPESDHLRITRSQQRLGISGHVVLVRSWLRVACSYPPVGVGSALPAGATPQGARGKDASQIFHEMRLMAFVKTAPGLVVPTYILFLLNVH